VVSVSERRLKRETLFLFGENFNGAGKAHQNGCRGNQKLPKSGSDWRLLSAVVIPVMGYMQMGRESHDYLIDLSRCLGCCSLSLGSSAKAGFVSRSCA
jgi:hypothetical protein